MISAEVKSNLLFYLLYQRNYLACATEYGGHGSDGIADVFGISKSGMTHEFEIKVSKADLAGELHAISFEKERQQDGTLFAPPRKAHKTSKHRFYLGNSDAHYLSPFRQKPNHFSFVVPDALADFAINACKGTPYGVLCFNQSGAITSKKNVGRIHTTPVDQKTLYNFLHKLSTEVDTLRREKLSLQLP